MKNFKWLQLFGEDAPDAGAGEETSTVTSEAPAGEESSNAQLDSLMSRIPEREKALFKRAYEKTHPTNMVEEQPQEQSVHIPFTELIKKPEYKDEHKAYMDKTIADRFKKSDAEIAALNQRNAQMQEVMGIFAQKYELDPSSENFIDTLKEKISSDESFYEDYAMKHDMSVQEAKRNLELQRKINALEMQERANQQKAEQDAAIRTMMGFAQKTKEEFPDFDLNAEMQNKEFRDLLTYYRGDTTRAYKALHFDDLMQKTVTANTEKAKQAITNSIASGQSRPIEGGLSNKSTAVLDTSYNWKGKSTKEMEEYAKLHLVRR